MHRRSSLINSFKSIIRIIIFIVLHTLGQFLSLFTPTTYNIQPPLPKTLFLVFSWIDSKSYYYQSRYFISFHIIVNSWSSKDFLLAKQLVKLLLGYFSMNIKSWPKKSVKLKSYLCFKLNLPFLITQVPYDIKDYTLLWTSITVLQAYSLKGRLIR